MPRESRYCLVVFIDDILNNEYRSIDVVPLKWIINIDKNVLCPFPTNMKDPTARNLHELVKKLQPPNEKWNFHRVEIRGYANTYDEALYKLKRLERESDVFSSETDIQDEFKPKNRLKGPVAEKETFKSSLSASMDINIPINIETEDAKNGKSNMQSYCNRDITDDSSDHSSDDNNEEESSEKVELSNPENDHMHINLKALSHDIQDLKEILTNGFKTLGLKLATIQSGVVANKIAIEELKDKSLRKNTIMENPLTRDLVLPFETLTAFREFDENLKVNDSLRKEINDLIWSLIDMRKDVIKTVTNILAKFFTGSVLANYTSSRPVPGKKIFKETELYKCAYAQLNSVLKKNAKDPITENFFCKSIGRVINNSKDWGGQRKKKGPNNLENYDGETSDRATE